MVHRCHKWDVLTKRTIPMIRVILFTVLQKIVQFSLSSDFYSDAISFLTSGSHESNDSPHALHNFDNTDMNM